MNETLQQTTDQMRFLSPNRVDEPKNNIGAFEQYGINARHGHLAPK